ncbi:DEAD/DEAH box helicase family protein [Arcanobacterium phocae]|uniref:DEAD/DEAH box helicase family protein n=1 Tax=Arcanobacterium phocae TaxID=131112 RepID=UPI001C0EBED8|nr:DEAD/DEAH box helicase family protein [Arcanobacterium phocae]
MRYTLKDYQADAVDKVLGNLTRARDMYTRYGDASQFSLSAATGAGKTVMAAAVIEALFLALMSLILSQIRVRLCCSFLTIPR